LETLVRLLWRAAGSRAKAHPLAARPITFCPLDEVLPLTNTLTTTNMGSLRECRSIRSGTSGLPYYCAAAPLVCVPAVIGLQAVWRHNQSKPNPNKKTSLLSTCLPFTLPRSSPSLRPGFPPSAPFLPSSSLSFPPPPRLLAFCSSLSYHPPTISSLFASLHSLLLRVRESGFCPILLDMGLHFVSVCLFLSVPFPVVGPWEASA